MLTSKYIDHFLDEVTVWQKKLSTADQVIGIWFEVQRTWSHLESIFIDSEDIRAQLPQDAERFDNIDSDFKVMLIIFTYHLCTFIPFCGRFQTKIVFYNFVLVIMQS